MKKNLFILYISLSCLGILFSMKLEAKELYGVKIPSMHLNINKFLPSFYPLNSPFLSNLIILYPKVYNQYLFADVKQINYFENAPFLKKKEVYFNSNHWSRLPFFANQAKEKGYDIEPPFVIGYADTSQEQLINPIEGSTKYTNLKTSDVMNVSLLKSDFASLGFLGNIIYGILQASGATQFSGGIDLNTDGSPNIKLDMQRSTEQTRTQTFRMGFWPLPFIQVYGILNKITGKSSTPLKSTIKIDTNNATINGIIDGNPPSGLTDPKLKKIIDDVIGKAVDRIVGEGAYKGNRIIEVDDVVHMNLDAVGYGGGITIAGGYKKLFFMIDMNYSYSKFDFSDDYLKTFVFSPRFGYNMLLFSRPFRVWLGFMGQYVSQKITGRLTGLSFAGNTGSLMENVIITESRFEMKQELVKPVNYVIGTRYTFTRNTAIMIEGGYGGKDGRKSVLLSAEVLF